MRIFTTRWYVKAQSDHSTASVWTNAFARYDAHLKTIRTQLPATLRRFSNVTYHDCALREASLLPDRVIRLTLDGFRRARNGKSAAAGRHEITLRAVSEIRLKPEQLGRYWVYEEVDLVGSAFRLSVLLDDRSVMKFCFGSLTFTHSP